VFSALCARKPHDRNAILHTTVGIPFGVAFFLGSVCLSSVLDITADPDGKHCDFSSRTPSSVRSLSRGKNGDEEGAPHHNNALKVEKRLRAIGNDREVSQSMANQSQLSTTFVYKEKEDGPGPHGSTAIHQAASVGRECSCDVHLCSLLCYSLGGASALVMFIFVLCCAAPYLGLEFL
jgi:hypothetical protein